MMMKKYWILEIHQQINRESSPQDPNTIIDTPNNEKQEHSNQNELQSNNDQNNTFKQHRTNTKTRIRNE